MADANQQINNINLMKNRQGSSLATHPSQQKEQEPTHATTASNLPNQEHPQNQYSNEFMTLIPHKRSLKLPIKPFLADNNGHRVNRSKTEPQQEFNKEGAKRKRKLILPEIKMNDISQPLERMKEKSIKLKELYDKKSKLYKRLQFINKKLITAKLDLSFPIQPTKQPNDPLTATIQQDHNAPNHKLQSKSYSNSRNHNYTHDYHIRPKNASPQSITSIDKNREVISFIQKMHAESIKRDLNRYERSQKIVASQLSHVCLECSRSKCQADVIGNILKESRFL